MSWLASLRKSAAIALVCALALVSVTGTGCTASKTAKASTGSVATYKIGVGMPLTAGATALGEGITRGAQLAIKDVNASERARQAGVKFEVITGDDLGDPKTGVNVANMFVGDPKVIGVMGHLNSGVCMPAAKVYAERDIPMVAPAATNPELTLQGLKNVFRLATIDTVQGSFAADSAYKLGMRKAFIVDDSTTYGVGLADEFGKAFEKDGGTILGREKSSDKDSEFNALATKIKAANPDVVYYGGIYNAGSLLLKQLREVGCKATFFGGDGLKDQQLVDLAGAADAEGTYATTAGLPIEKMAEGQKFTAAYQKEFPGKEMSAYDPYGYDCTMVILNAALKVAEEKGANSLNTPPGRKAIIAVVAKSDFVGVTGKIGFDSKGDTLNKAVTLYVVKNGKYELAQ